MKLLSHVDYELYKLRKAIEFLIPIIYFLRETRKNDIYRISYKFAVALGT